MTTTRHIPGRRAALTAACAALLLAATARAQDVPLVGQPTANFFGAAGSGVKVAWAVEPRSVPEGEELVATLIVSNVTNPRKVRRPDLKTLPDFNDRFAVTDGPDVPVAGGATEVRFAYRLRPRSRQTAEVPTLAFYYFNPAAPAGKEFKQTNTGRPVPITVTAAPPKAPPAPVPLTEPDHLFAIATGPGVLGRDPGTVPAWAWPAAALAGPLLAVAWYAAWVRVYPDAQRLARARRSRAARRAVDAVARADRTPDPPAAVAAAVLHYLRERFGLPPGAATPSEIAAAIAQHGTLEADCAAVAGFFRACDAARFAPPSDGAVSLTADARALVLRLEAA
ncbi:hypothetical protein [Gemmata sp.]|uniref:hypothetical protein n=1 Tax=Gemmata sp. TaxID=1914242 RepID=UPI003F7274C6